MQRLLENKDFTESNIIIDQINKYQFESNSTLMFLEHEEFIPSTHQTIPANILYRNYKSYCIDSGLIAKSIKAFSPELEKEGFKKMKTRSGQVFYIEKKSF